MARLTKDQIIEKINTLTEKLNRLEERWERKQIKMEKEFQKDIARCPYEQICMAGNYTVTEEMLRKHHEFDKQFEQKLYEESVQKAEDDIEELKSRLNCLMVKELEANTYAELRKPIPELVKAVRCLVQNWIDFEKHQPEHMRYYSTMQEKFLMEFVVMPISEEITIRSFYKIGKISRFTEPMIRYGKIDIFCFNDEGKHCHLYATVVCGHQRTNEHGTTFDVRPHLLRLAVTTLQLLYAHYIT